MEPPDQQLLLYVRHYGAQCLRGTDSFRAALCFLEEPKHEAIVPAALKNSDRAISERSVNPRVIAPKREHGVARSVVTTIEKVRT
jgi:hypothetical protein